MVNVQELLGRLKKNLDTRGVPPFSRFEGTTKQIRCAELSELERLALQFGFPLFLGRHPALKGESNPVENELRDADLLDESSRQVSQFCRRRFSGDASAELPRSRYSAISLVDEGDDDGTLICELNSYALPNMTGYAVAKAGPSEESIEILFRGLPGEPNPLHEAIRDPDLFNHVFKGLPADPMLLTKAAKNPKLRKLVSRENEQSIQVQCSIERHEIGKCLDLRQPEARGWTVAFFQNPPAGLHGDALRALSAAHGINLETVRGWAELLPIVGSRNMGGNSLTDMFGAYLRYLGCEALIYPSSRNDYSARFEDARLISHAGWNLVDYRGAAQPQKVALEFGDPIEPLSGNNDLEEIGVGPNAGSILFTGNRQSGQVTNQLLFEQGLKFRITKWQRDNKGDDLFVRGYYWYRKKYDLGTPPLLLFCDCCEKPFAEPHVQLSRRCPSCGYMGDQ